MRLVLLVAVAAVAGLGAVSIALAQEATCTDFRTLEDGQKVTFAYGYLEGVQAALDKEVTDILVPPSDERHPAWWVLPTGLGEKPASALANKLDSHCRSTANSKQTLLTAFLAISHKQDGWPSIGISTDKKKTDPWRNLLGGKESSVSCAGYLASRDGTRQAIVHGYYLGTQALKTRLGGAELVWPTNSTPQGVRLEVDRSCRKEKTATLRDVLWVITAELSVRKPRSFKCEQPLPEFTLGAASNPSDAELAKLCACIWSKLPEGGWERDVSAKIRRGEDPGWRGRGFMPRFGAALDACGGRSL